MRHIVTRKLPLPVSFSSAWLWKCMVRMQPGIHGIEAEFMIRKVWLESTGIHVNWSVTDRGNYDAYRWNFVLHWLPGRMAGIPGGLLACFVAANFAFKYHQNPENGSVVLGFAAVACHCGSGGSRRRVSSLLRCWTRNHDSQLLARFHWKWTLCTAGQCSAMVLKGGSICDRRPVASTLPSIFCLFLYPRKVLERWLSTILSMEANS
jgi:hypothetical protein